MYPTDVNSDEQISRYNVAVKRAKMGQTNQNIFIFANNFWSIHSNLCKFCNNWELIVALNDYAMLTLGTICLQPIRAFAA